MSDLVQANENLQRQVDALQKDMGEIVACVEVIKKNLPMADLNKLLHQEFNLMKLLPIVKKLKKADFPALNTAFDDLGEFYKKYVSLNSNEDTRHE